MKAVITVQVDVLAVAVDPADFRKLCAAALKEMAPSVERGATAGSYRFAGDSELQAMLEWRLDRV